MKNIEEILESKKIEEIEFYLDYYEMIEDMFRHKTDPPSSFYEEKRKLEERFRELSLKIRKVSF